MVCVSSEIWGGPIRLLIGIYILWSFLGPSCFVGIASAMILIPMNIIVEQLVGHFQFPCRNCGGGDRGGVAIYRPFGEFRRAKIALSPVWCSRPTTGVPLAHATMNFVGLDLTTSDRNYIHQQSNTTINSRQDASPLGRLVEGEERRETPDPPSKLG
ncbi:hypothetical protein TNCV_2507901 [Trichonephila clavipes]|nr:hypothetical protein TNCV_2507901 [Trichonephila clavipes]